MSRQSLVDAIHSEGEDRIQTIEIETRIRAEEMVDEAHVEAQRVQAEARARVVASANRERARLLQHARLDAVKIVGEAHEALIATVLQNVREKLSEVRTTPAYTSILRQLVHEALQELDKALRDHETALLEVDPRDRQALDEVLQGRDREFQVNDTLSTLGGVIVRSEDGRVTVINTLESRLERAIPHLRSNLLNLSADFKTSS